MQRDPCKSRLFRAVECVGVQRLVGNDVVLQQSLEVGLAFGAKEESKDLWTKKLEAMVIWREEGGASSMGFGNFICKASFGEGELEGRELAGEVRYNG